VPDATTECGLNKKSAIIVAVIAAAVVLVAGALAVRGSSDSALDAAKTEAGKRTATAAGPQGATDPNADAKSAKKGASPSATAIPPLPDKGTSTLVDGAKLGTVEQPPNATLALLDSKAATAGSRYTVTFRPYGTVRGGGVVVSVTKWDVEGHFKKTVDLSKRNVLLRYGTPSAEKAVTKGGTYVGLVELRDENGVLVPRLLSAKKDG